MSNEDLERKFSNIPEVKEALKDFEKYLKERNLKTPTEYSDEILAKAKEYLTVWDNGVDVIPSVEALAEYIDRSRASIYNWAKQEDKKEFLDTLDKINELQKRVLINKGLKGDFNSNITKLALGNHGMSEKLQQEVSGPGGKEISIIERVIIDSPKN